MAPSRSRKQSGGFYPSVFEGVKNAYILLPAVLRTGYSLWNSRKTVSRRRISKRRKIMTKRRKH